MALSLIEQHYNKHKEDLRLQRRHGIVEFQTTMHILHKYIQMLLAQPSATTSSEQQQPLCILDIGAGTGRYTSALMAEGHRVKAVELVKRNIEVFLKREPTADVVQGDARNMPFLEDNTADITLLLGPMYHLMGDEAKTQALREAKRVTKPGGLILVAYLMNEYSILSYCFDQDRMGELIKNGMVDESYHVRATEEVLYDYVRIDDIDRFNQCVGLERATIFSPDGAADYMRTRLNYMSDETFQHFIRYQQCICERPELIGAGSHVVDVVRKPVECI